MVYICGLLLSEARYLKNLCIEISNSATWGNCLDTDCLSWRDAGSTGKAELFEIKQTEWPTRPDHSSEAQLTIVDRITFLLKPLALPGRVQACKITVYDDIPITPDLKDIIHHYREALTDKRPFGYKESKWLWDEYMSILDRLDESERRQQQLKAEKHETWLLIANLRYKCKHHSSTTKKYSRSCGKDAQCDGCRKWSHWLLKCRKCEVRACTSCMSDLRKELSPLQKVKMHEVWLLHTHSRYYCRHPPRAAKRYRRPCGKDAKCDGCEKDFHWLMQCRECKFRACASCTSELRGKRSALQERVRLEWEET